jgi:hypothetical protein
MKNHEIVLAQAHAALFDPPDRPSPIFGAPSKTRTTMPVGAAGNSII